MINAGKHKLFFLILFILIYYPLLYYVYKFYSPLLGGNDFFHYYNLYKNFDVQNTEAPFNMRLLSSFIVYMINQLGICYSTYIHFNDPKIDPCVFFNAILVNWVSVVVTAYLIFIETIKKFNDITWGLTISLIFFLSFGTIFFLLSPISDGFSVMLITITYVFYKNKSNLIYLFYLFLLFQREFAFVIFGLISFIEFIYTKSRWYLLQCIINVLFFIFYYFLRKTVFFTPLYSNQISEQNFIHSFFYISLDVPAFIRQVFLSQNIYMIYFLMVLINYRLTHQINKKHIMTLILFVFITFIISRIAVANNNMGRFLFMFVPILILDMLLHEVEKFKQKIH
mgnify:CR=1 FL=1